MFVADGLEIAVFSTSGTKALQRYTPPFLPLALHAMNDERTLAISGVGTILLWNADTLLTRTLQMPNGNYRYAMAATHDNRFLVASWGLGIECWNTETGNFVGSYALSSGQESPHWNTRRTTNGCSAATAMVTCESGITDRWRRWQCLPRAQAAY